MSKQEPAAAPASSLEQRTFAIAALLVALFAVYTVRTADADLWAPLLILIAAGVGRWFLFRPQLVTFLLMAVYVLTLFQHLLARPARLWLLPSLMPFWASSHGGFLAGIGAVGLALLLREL